ncbi:MAG: hypothetical protein MK188_02020 [Gammaproteobacteria bacterium]|nr:hypothetical protein [Gammaproteobacteria bacterium]
MRNILLLLFGLCFFMSSAQAEIDGKKVVFVHGLQTKAFTLLFDPNRQSKLEADAQSQAGSFLQSRFDDFIYFDSAKRLSANSVSLYQQVKRIEQAQTCSDGCYFFTASTGDLVTRYILSKLGQWGIDRNKFKVLLTFDLVGAGGGTEGADTIVAVVQGNPISVALNSLFAQFFLGTQIDFGSLVGIINDLRPSVARQTAMQANVVPRLRIAAGEETFLISAFLKGGDDSVVPLHSACGSSRQEAVDSCSRSIELDGRLKSSSGPRSFLYNHFPIAMATDMKHTDTDYTGRLVAVNNNSKFGPLSYDVNERSYSTGWWIFKKKYRVIDKPNSMKATEFFVTEIEE